MLISFNEIVKKYLQLFKIRGILHIGAHDCEELESYEKEGIHRNNIVWIDAIQEKVNSALKRKIPNVYSAVISDTETSCNLNITNNSQSTSILDLDTHKTEYPQIFVIETRHVKTKTLKTFFQETNLDPTKYNFWNLDIQGVELNALKGAGDLLNNVDAIYTEVNVKHLYKDCALLHEVDQYLASYGFQKVCEVILHSGWGDALYVKRASA